MCCKCRSQTGGQTCGSSMLAPDQKRSLLLCPPAQPLLEALPGRAGRRCLQIPAGPAEAAAACLWRHA